MLARGCAGIGGSHPPPRSSRARRRSHGPGSATVSGSAPTLQWPDQTSGYAGLGARSRPREGGGLGAAGPGWGRPRCPSYSGRGDGLGRQPVRHVGGDADVLEEVSPQSPAAGRLEGSGLELAKDTWEARQRTNGPAPHGPPHPAALGTADDRSPSPPGSGRAHPLLSPERASDCGHLAVQTLWRGPSQIGRLPALWPGGFRRS